MTESDIPSAELLARYQRYDPAAEEELFRRYAERLTRLARSRLSRKLSARVDAEDVVLSAYRSFFLLARDGEVILRQSGDLWRLLVRIALRKVCRSARRHGADCRAVDREERWSEDTEAVALSREPTPADAAALIDEMRSLLAPLSAVQRRIVELRLQGHEVEEIAAAVERSPRTVRRTLSALGEELERRLKDDERSDPSAQRNPSPQPPPRSGEGEPEANPTMRVAYGDIVLRQQLGEGGMGKVYRALWRSRGVQVAVKLLKKPLRQHDRTIALFLEEASLLARMKHPGIVAVHGLGRLPDGGQFLVMDLVEGSDLGRQRAGDSVRVDQALRWVSEAADAIEHAHQRGVVHCDLKPSNLLLDRDGRIRVSDFGLARSLGAGEAGAAGGTAGFMAPELIDPVWGAISPRTDVYGLGAVLYTLLTGMPPGPADALAEPPALRVARPDVPASVDALCRRCLAREPEHRFASAAELAAALRDVGRPA